MPKITKLTMEDGIDGLRHRPWRDGKDKLFCYATTTKPLKMSRWNGEHPVEENSTEHEAPAGTTVLVTMASRFGDVGIRDHDLVPASEGYCCRCDPATDLTDWRTEP